MVAVVLAFGAIGGGAAYLLLLGSDDDGAPFESSALPVGDAPADADAAPPESRSAPSGADDYDSSSSEDTETVVLPDASTSEMEEDIAGLLVDFHEAVVDRRFTDAWGHLSRRKQDQVEREDGFPTWRKAQASLTPYLEPWGLDVSIEGLDRSEGVARVSVTGMGWTEPGASCSEWSGLTWAKYEDGGWRYDPGYSTTPERRQTWEKRLPELLGVGC